MKFIIEYDQEVDGRWIAEIPALPGVMCYGRTQDEARSKVEALARRVQAERSQKDEFRFSLSAEHFAPFAV